MTAGRGIVHSERTAADRRQPGSRLRGLQIWVLPWPHVRRNPRSTTIPARACPSAIDDGVRLRVLRGASAVRLPTSPVETLSPLLLRRCRDGSGTVLAAPRRARRASPLRDRRAVACGTEADRGRPHARLRPRGERDTPRRFAAGSSASGGRASMAHGISAGTSCRARRRASEQAKARLEEGRFPKVPGDDLELVPFPNERGALPVRTPGHCRDTHPLPI